MNNIDRIFVISLDTATERQKIFNERFPELIKLPIFEWFIVKRDNENSERGAYTSHKTIIKVSKERNYKTIIIMEDDCDLLVTWQKFIETINNIKRPNNWHYIMLGYSAVRTMKTEDPRLLKIICALGGHGYMVNVDKVDYTLYSGIQIDSELFCNDCELSDVIRKDCFKKKNGIYGILPVLLRQRSKTSTISNLHNAAGNFEIDRNTIAEMASNFNMIHTLLFLIFFILLFLWLLIILIWYRKFKYFKWWLFVTFVILLTFIIMIIVENEKLKVESN